MKRLVFINLILIQLLLNAQDKLTSLADPFIGTDAHGHTFPGAVFPFGMVQLSPDTDNKGWDWCSGYHSSDSSIMGFSHTHLSGTGGADYGDILFMPFAGKINFEPGDKSNPDSGYRSRFSKKSEKAKPGYYTVFLEDYKISAELTVTERTAFHRYTFPSSDSSFILIDLDHGISDRTVESFIEVINNKQVQGMRRSSGWAKDQHVFFFAEFSKPFDENIFYRDGERSDSIDLIKGIKTKCALRFSTDNGESILVKVGISFVDIDGAKKNLMFENRGWDFDAVYKRADSVWNSELSKIKVKGKKIADKINFYTAMYHTMIAPNIFSDFDGRYRGMDNKIYISDYTHYTVFSLWDTFRALHPLFVIIDQRRTLDFIRSLLDKYKHAGILPVWELAANETWTMIGYHSVFVIVDAYIKGIKDFDVELAFEAMKNSAVLDHHGLKYYKTYGFIPMDKNEDAASKTLEYAYDDWCIAVMANELGFEEEKNYFADRSLNYKNLFDKQTHFIRGRYSDGTWKKNFNPLEAFPLGAGEFTEASSWQYTWFVPHDINGLIKMMGGDKLFTEKLDKLFTLTETSQINLPSDVTGLIGQYAHGNEPGHHISYLYNFAGQSWKTQKMARKIMTELYKPERDGLCGNEDCGQLSAWYIFSAMGFYPVLPASDKYILGSPLFDEIEISLDNGKKFVVISKGNSDDNVFVESISVNNESSSKSYINHDQIMNGSKLEFVMSDKPNYNFGLELIDRPSSLIGHEFTPVESKVIFRPYDKSNTNLFLDTVEVELDSYTRDSEIYYTLDGSEPSINSEIYNEIIKIKNSTRIRAKTLKRGIFSDDELDKFYHKAVFINEKKPILIDGEVYPKIKLANKYSDKYTGGSEYALLDGALGSTNFRDGLWQGFQYADLEAFIDLGERTQIKNISIGFLKNHDSWIFYPDAVEVYCSDNGENYELIKSKKMDDNSHYGEVKKSIVEFSLEGDSIRFLLIKAVNIGHCPPWHHAAGGGAWLFSDEIIVEKL